MGPALRPQGRIGQRQFSLRGTVIKHITKTKGWWIFKTEYSGLLVQLNADQLKLHKERYGNIAGMDGQSEEMPERIEIFLSDEMMESFPINTEVGVTFAQGSPLEQFFQGASPITLLNVVRTSEVTRLKDEILPAQLSLL